MLYSKKTVVCRFKATAVCISLGLYSYPCIESKNLPKKIYPPPSYSLLIRNLLSSSHPILKLKIVTHEYVFASASGQEAILIAELPLKIHPFLLVLLCSSVLRFSFFSWPFFIYLKKWSHPNKHLHITGMHCVIISIKNWKLYAILLAQLLLLKCFVVEKNSQENTQIPVQM